MLLLEDFEAVTFSTTKKSRKKNENFEVGLHLSGKLLEFLIRIKQIMLKIIVPSLA